MLDKMVGGQDIRVAGFFGDNGAGPLATLGLSPA